MIVRVYWEAPTREHGERFKVCREGLTTYVQPDSGSPDLYRAAICRALGRPVMVRSSRRIGHLAIRFEVI
jgi:hypothetical protein